MNKKSGFSINLGGLELGDTNLFDDTIFDTPVEDVEVYREKEIVKPKINDKVKEMSKADIIKKYTDVEVHNTSIDTSDIGILCTDEDFDDSFDELNNSEEAENERLISSEIISEDNTDTDMNNEISFEDENTEPEEADISEEIDNINFKDENTEPEEEDISEEIDNINFEDENTEPEEADISEEIDNIDFEDENTELKQESDNTEDIGIEIEDEIDSIEFENDDTADKDDSISDNSKEDDGEFSLEDLDTLEELDTDTSEISDDTGEEITFGTCGKSVESVNNDEQLIDLDNISFTDLQDESLSGNEEFEKPEEIIEDTHINVENAVKKSNNVSIAKGESKSKTSENKPIIKEIDDMHEIRAEIADIKRIIQSRDEAGASTGALNVGEDKNREFRKNSKSLDPKAEIEKYNSMTIDSLYKEVKDFMIKNGVKRCPVALDILNKKFGDKNIARLVRTSYLIILGKGVTIGR